MSARPCAPVDAAPRPRLRGLSHRYAGVAAVGLAAAAVASAPPAAARVGASGYGTTMVGMFAASAWYHAARRPDPWPAVFGYHEVFHALVIAAVLVQYLAIVRDVLPLRS